MKNFLVIFLITTLSFIMSSMHAKANVLPIVDDYLVSAEVMPEPVGGLVAIYKNISYPAAAQSAGTQGKVYLMIMINETGGIDDVKVIKGIGNGCDEAAIEGVKKSKFTSGKLKGAAVKVKLALAIEFKL